LGHLILVDCCLTGSLVLCRHQSPHPSRDLHRHDEKGSVIDIVRKPPEQRGFAVHRKRWVVERTLAWLTAHRRLARDYERDPEVSEELIRWAAINQMLRRVARGKPAARQQRRTLQQARVTAL